MLKLYLVSLSGNATTLFTPRFGALFLLLILFEAAAVADDISLSGNPGSLVINSAVAGSAPFSTADSTTTYTVMVNAGSTGKIMGSLSSSAPPNTTLKVHLTAPPGATSSGSVTLSTTAQDLVTNISEGTYSNLSITYSFSATCAAGVVSSTNRTVTLSIVAQ